MFLIHEATKNDGTLFRICLHEHDAILFLVDDSGEHPLPEGALEAVMLRYAKPLESPMTNIVDTLALSNGTKLSRFRHLAIYDVIARDYIAYETPETEPICELATAVTAALSHLARAATMKNS
ncbi:MAG: hypothetical protein ABI183_07475 [Polyangiaceae bacterium]